jgi:hypothetical protein
VEPQVVANSNPFEAIHWNRARFGKNRLFHQHPSGETGCGQIGQRSGMVLGFCRNDNVPRVKTGHGLAYCAMVPETRTTADNAHTKPEVGENPPVTRSDRSSTDYHGPRRPSNTRFSSGVSHDPKRR